MYIDNHLTWLFNWNAKNELYFNFKIWLKKAAIRWSSWSFIICASWQEGTDAAWRSRCRAGRGTIALDGRHPSRRLQADNWSWQARGCLLTWPRQSRRRRLSRSLATSEEMLSVVMPCLGKFGEWFFFFWGKNECHSSGSTATLFIYQPDETLHGRAFSLLGNEEPFVWWRHWVTASALSVVTQRETVCVGSSEYSTVFLEEPGTPIMELLWNSRVQGWCGHWRRKRFPFLYNLKSASGPLCPHSLAN